MGSAPEAWGRENGFPRQPAGGGGMTIVERFEVRRGRIAAPACGRGRDDRNGVGTGYLHSFGGEISAKRRAACGGWRVVRRRGSVL